MVRAGRSDDLESLAQFDCRATTRAVPFWVIEFFGRQCSIFMIQTLPDIAQLHKNQLKRLPDSFVDLILLTYLDLSYVT